MSAFIFVLILVSLAQCHATGFFWSIPDTTNLTPIYIVTSNTVPDNSIEAQQYICPGFRSVWGAYEEYTQLCFSDNTSYYTLINDPAPAGFMTRVQVRYSTFTSCIEKNQPFQIIASVVEPLSTCRQFLDDGFTTLVYTKTPFPQDEASPLGLPKQILIEVSEDSQLFARHVSLDGPNGTTGPNGPTCVPADFMFWFTTGECLRELNANTAFVYTFDNFQVYNQNFYADANCTIQRRDSASFLINQCLDYLGFGTYTTFPKPVIFEGVSSESSESIESIEDSPGLGVTLAGEGEESGDTDGVSTTVKVVVASVSACVLFVAAVAMYFKGRYCVRKESQETNLNLDDVAVVIA